MFFLACFGVPKKCSPRGCARVGVRGGTQLIDYKNKALVYLYLDSLLPLRYGGFYRQPGGLVPRARGRIYVAFGEHPAAGGLYMFLCTPGLYPMRSYLVVLVVGTCGCLCSTLQGLVVSLWHFGWPWGSIVTPWASILTHMGYSWESSGHFGETLGLHFGTLGSIWVPLGSMLVSCGHCGVWPSTRRATFVEKA